MVHGYGKHKVDLTRQEITAAIKVGCPEALEVASAKGLSVVLLCPGLLQGRPRPEQGFNDLSVPSDISRQILSAALLRQSRRGDWLGNWIGGGHHFPVCAGRCLLG